MPRNEKSLNTRVNLNIDNQTASEMEQESEIDIHSQYSQQSNYNTENRESVINLTGGTIHGNSAISSNSSSYLFSP